MKKSSPSIILNPKENKEIFIIAQEYQSILTVPKANFITILMRE